MNMDFLQLLDRYLVFHFVWFTAGEAPQLISLQLYAFKYIQSQNGLKSYKICYIVIFTLFLEFKMSFFRLFMTSHLFDKLNWNLNVFFCFIISCSIEYDLNLSYI